jgi:hypothetical protein
MSRFLRRQLQLARLHPLAETFETIVGIPLILATRHKGIGKPVPIRFTPAVPPHPALAPDIHDRVEVDMGKARRENRALRRTDLCDLPEPVFHDACLEPPGEQAEDPCIAAPLPEQLQPPRVMHRVEEAA